MTTSMTVGAISTDVVAQATGRIGVLLERSRRGGGARHLAACQLSSLQRRPEPGRVTALLAFTNLLETAAESTGMDHLGLEMARLQRTQDMSLLRRLSAHAPTVGQALQDMIRYFPTVQTGTQVGLSRSGGSAMVTYRILDPSVHRSRQDSAFTLGRMFRQLKATAGAGWRMDQVTMEGAAPRCAHVYREFFEVPVHFEAGATALCFPASVLALSNPSADAARYAELCASLDLRLQCRDEAALLEDALGAWILSAPRRSGTVNLEDAADDFGISVRTLQRRLNALGLNFSDLRSRVRMEAARRWLTDSPLSVSHIGEELGFSETSAFTRAFRSYTQQSPRAFRRAGLAA